MTNKITFVLFNLYQNIHTQEKKNQKDTTYTFPLKNDTITANISNGIDNVLIISHFDNVTMYSFN